MAKEIKDVQFEFAQGIEANLPELLLGEPAVTTDTEKFFIGMSSGNKEVALKENVLNASEFDNIQPNAVNAYTLTGKTWNALGDSITAGITSSREYVSIISTANNMGTSKNYGRGGTLITYTGDGYSFLERYPSMNDGVDLITVMGGTNDCLGNVTIGTLDSRDNTTFYGALNELIDGLTNKYPNGRVIFITPLKFKSTNTTNNNNLVSYVNAIKSACENKNIECIDMNTELTLLDSDYADGTHPNDSGQQKIADYITGKLQVLKSNIVNLKMNDNKVYPVTAASAVYMAEGGNLEDYLKNILARLQAVENGSSISYGNIVISKTSATVTEGGTDTFTVKLDAAPTNEQIINLSVDNSYITLSESSLTFTASNYNTERIITISSSADSIDVNQTSIITISSLGVDSQILTVNIINNSGSGSEGGDIQPENNLVAYYLASQHGADDTVFKDISGNNNNATITGTNTSWDSNGLVFNKGTGILTLPIKPMETNKDFKLEILISNVIVEEYVRNTICNCLETSTYTGGINIEKDVNANLQFKIRASDVLYALDVSTNTDNLKISIERSGNTITIKVNDETVKTGTCKTITSDENLVFGPGAFSLNYIKYYEY